MVHFLEIISSTASDYFSAVSFEDFGSELETSISLVSGLMLTVKTEPVCTFPLRISSAIGSSRYFWIARFNGRAPKLLS
ncbi:hypothetical protein D3C80_1762860 [compost metagenome]